MIKAITITLISAGVIGTGAHTFQPEALELTTGSALLEMSAKGLIIKTTDNPDFAISFRLKDERRLSFRL